MKTDPTTWLEAARQLREEAATYTDYHHGTIVAYCRAAAPPMGEVFHPGPLPSPPSEASQLPAGETER